MKKLKAGVIGGALALVMAAGIPVAAHAVPLAYYTGDRNCTSGAAMYYYQFGSSKGSAQWTQLNKVNNTYNDRYYSNTSFVYRYQTAYFRNASGSITAERTNLSGEGSTCDN